MDNQSEEQEINTDDDMPGLIHTDDDMPGLIHTDDDMPGLIHTDDETDLDYETAPETEPTDNVRIILETYLNNLMEELNTIIDYPKYTYIKDNEPLTIIYTEEEQLILPAIVVVDYNNKYDLNYIINSTNHSLFVEKYAIDLSRYIRDDTIPDYVTEYIDEIDGIENKPICKEGLEKISSIKYIKEDNKDDKCQICLGDFDENSDVVKLECNHIFCETCIKTYLETYNNICPLNMFLYMKKEEKIVNEDEVDMRHVTYTFMTKYCERCNDCPRHKNRNHIIDLYMVNQGYLDLEECIKLIKD